MSKAAVIVIGSNSTRCVAADLSNIQAQPIRSRVETRLFLGMEKNMLSGAAMEDTLAGIASLIQGADAEVLGIYATSAVRDARNGDLLAQETKARFGLPLTILSGEEEAAASFYGAVGDDAAGMVDIGGGSTELAIGKNGMIREAISLQLGASRLFKAHPIPKEEDVAPAIEAARKLLDTLPAALIRHEGISSFYSVGGTGTACATLAMRAQVKALCEGYRLTADTLHKLLHLVAATPREQRAAIPGFPASRIDILPTGMAILAAVMERLRLDQITVTQRCNADGLLRRAALGRT